MALIKEYDQFIISKRINESMSGGNVRTRFAPSPTGSLHCGGIRTALYNYLFTKQNGGEFILRIEDTDSTRFVPTAEKYIEDTFEWLGIEFDESPSKGGPYGPYRQSERREIYKEYYKELIDSGNAYYAFDTADELNQVREDIENFSYNYQTRDKMKNSLTLSDEEVNELLKTQTDWVVRIKYPDTPINIVISDLVRGNVTVNSSTVDDKVIWKKKDDLPTYHLANVVDDHLMKITHVIRGEEWLPSAPLHVYLYDCFGWDCPTFAHLALILGPDGSKLSKRDGDKYGFPVFPLSYTDFNDDTKIVQGYRENGYLPEAVLNILAFIGWNPGTEKEVYTIDELIKDFDLSRVNKAGAKFNPVKAGWFNGQHIKNTDSKELLPELKSVLQEKGVDLDDDFILKVLDENKGKVNFVKDIYDQIEFLFKAPTTYDSKLLRKISPDSNRIVSEFTELISDMTNWDAEDIKTKLEEYVANSDVNFNDIAMPIRLLLTGKGYGSFFELMETLGKEETLNRLSVELPIVERSTEVKVDNSKQVAMIKEIELIKKIIKGGEAKLNNKKFTERAPEAVVAKERIKIDELKIKLSDLESKV